MDVDGNKRVFQRLGGAPNGNNKQFQKVCFHWRAGKCTRHPCPYLHRELPVPPMHHNTNGGSGGMSSSKRGQGFSEESGFSGARQRTSNFNNSSTWGRVGGNRVEKKTDKVCNYWIQGNCGYGDRCKFLHSWSLGDVLSLTQLEGHQKVVTGIAFPSGSDKLYSVSKDETMKLWDCQSGQCTGTLNLGGEVGCIISEGPWLFFGLPNLVKAWNTQTNSDLSLSGPIGQVYALVAGNGLLFAGTQDGSILIWKFNPATNNFDPAASLKGHTLAVISLVIGANRLYSGSMDTTIRAWDLEALQCIQTLTDHSAVVMSVLCWDQFLLSCSLDKTIKVWVATDGGNLEVTYTHTEEHGILTLCGMHDSESKPILLSACNDNCVRLYDLPSFTERGKVFTKEEVRAIQTGPIGLFFTGDGTGQVKVWKLEASAGTT